MGAPFNCQLRIEGDNTTQAPHVHVRFSRRRVKRRVRKEAQRGRTKKTTIDSKTGMRRESRVIAYLVVDFGLGEPKKEEFLLSNCTPLKGAMTKQLSSYGPFMGQFGGDELGVVGRRSYSFG